MHRQIAPPPIAGLNSQRPTNDPTQKGGVNKLAVAMPEETKIKGNSVSKPSVAQGLDGLMAGIVDSDG